MRPGPRRVCGGNAGAPGDHREDPTLRDTTLNLLQRPRHLQVAIEPVLGDAALAPVTRQERVGLIGYSLGAYTALALAGGAPRTLPEPWPDGASEPIAVQHDPRIAAVVLLAPAVVWFHAPGWLDVVRAPVLMRAGEQARVTPPAHHADFVAQRLPGAAPLQYRQIPGAGHVSFLSAFPPTMYRPGLAPAQDPPGFDRAAYQHELAEDVASCLAMTLV